MGVKNYDLIVGFDSEYVPGARSNRVLCISAAVLNPKTGQRFSTLQHFDGHTHQERWALRTFISVIVRAAVDEGVLPRDALVTGNKKKRVRILLVAHFTRADLPAFRDFKTLKRKFDGIRKTYVTLMNPLVTDIKPYRVGVPVSITLRDTLLLSPAGSNSLRALGEILGFPKLTLPSVIDEDGQRVPGIERMDLTRNADPIGFEEYARRDAEVSVSWLLEVSRLASSWGLTDVPSTVGSMAVGLFQRLVPDFKTALGYVDGEDETDLHPFIAENLNQIANCFHGGRNECFASGIFEAVYQDWDFAGAYTTGMAALRPVAWDDAALTTDLDRLAVLDAISLAHVRFSFPPSTRFPSLPVATEYGLIYPLSGESWCAGPELVVAIGQGAAIEVVWGVTAPWADDTRPFVQFTRAINRERASHPKGSPPERLAKEAGNSLYGKVAQGVSRFKTIQADTSKMFNTRTGHYAPLPPSSVTQPVFAAMITGLLRAALSEALARLPDGVHVISATTDGWLSTAAPDVATAAADGPVGRYFSELRALVSADGSRTVLERKGTCGTVLAMKTRGAIALAPGGDQPYPIAARAGHKLDTPVSCPKCLSYNCGHPERRWAEAGAWLHLYRNRTPDTVLHRRDLIPLADQWRASSDLTAAEHSTTVSLEWDWKRQPINPRNVDGLLQFNTMPWGTVDAFLETRKRFDRWPSAAGTCMVTADDLHAFLNLQPARGVHAARLARGLTFSRSLRVALLHGYADFPTLTPTEVARLLTSVGIKTTHQAVSKVRGSPDPTGSVEGLTVDETIIFPALQAMFGADRIASLFRPKSE